MIYLDIFCFTHALSVAEIWFTVRDGLLNQLLVVL